MMPKRAARISGGPLIPLIYFKHSEKFAHCERGRGALRERDPHRTHGERRFRLDLEKFVFGKLAADIFPRDAGDAHSVFGELDHQFQASAFDFGMQMDPDGMGKVYDRFARDRVGIQHEQRIIVHVFQRLHALGKRGKLFVCDKRVVQGHDRTRKDKIFVVHGQIQKCNVALVVFEKIQRFRRDAVDQIQFDVGIFFMILRDLVDQNIGKNRIRRADADRTRRFRVDLFELVFRRVQFSERLFDNVKNLFAALLGKLHPAVRTVEQRRAQLPFQLFDRLRYRRLADKKLIRRTRQTSALGNRVEYPVQFQIDH